MWQATTIDNYSRVTAATIGTTASGTTAASWTFNTTTNLLSQIKGTDVQQYDYDFSGSTGNLNWRTNTLKSKTENFGYDTENLDRLVSVTGASAQTIGYDAAVMGNILTKTDVGTYTYNSTKKYAVKTITNGLNISETNQNIIYNAFNKVQTISEGTKTADFVYNADHQRIRMTLKTSGTTTKTRYYFGGSCERQVEGSTTRQYIWIGGDAYTAVAVATKVGTGNWIVYRIFRDHLGTITHLKTGNATTEFSYDAWGRRRDKDDWSYTLDATEPALFADRGFTSLEFLADFNLYNMNGRLYDPVVGRFLNADNNVQMADFTQNYNRYTYCLNNPLKYTDPSGEIIWMPIIVLAIQQAIVGGARANLEGEDILKGAGKGAIMGAVGGGLSMIGGAGMSYIANLAIGTGSGALTGGLDAALWGNDIGKGMLWGAVGGAVFTTLTSENFSN